VIIDDGLPDEWNPDIRVTCALYRQGHLVEAPPFFYIAAPRRGIWSLTKEFGDSSLDEDLLESEDRPEYGLITTETCDLTEEAASRPRQPWIAVAPVYDLSDRVETTQLNNLSSNRIQYLRLLDPPGVRGGLWVVDFRIEVPIEKGWLVGRYPIDAYQRESDYEALARALAARRERPVYSDDVHKALTRPLRRWIERMRPERRDAVLGVISEVRVLFAGDPLDPDAASLLIITDSESLGDGPRQVWDDKWEDFKLRMERVGIPLLATEYETLDTCPARRYLDSYQIDLSFAI